MILYHITRIVPKYKISASGKYFHMFLLKSYIEIGSLKLEVGLFDSPFKTKKNAKAIFFSISQMIIIVNQD